MQVPAGSTNVQVPIYARATSGAALTGKVAADFALSYRRDGAAVSIALSNLTALTDAHSDGGIKEVGNGEYRLDVPDAAFAAGASKVTIGGTVDGGVVLGYPIELAISAWDELKSEHTTAGTFGLWLGTKLWNWIGAVAGKTADTATRAEINATTAGAGYNETTDSLEANRDNIGTAGAGLTAVGAGSSLTAQEVRDAMKLAPTAGDPAAGSVDKHLDDILEDTSTTLPASIAAVPTAGEIDTQLSGTHGTGTWGSSGAGTGSRTIVFTVTASSVALQGARVRLYRTGSTDRTGDTNASGQLTLYCDVDATWSYVVTHPLYDSESGTVVVDGNEAVPVAMTTIAVTAATDPDQTTAYWYVYGNDGALVGSADVTATIEIVDVPDDRGYAYDDTPLTLTSTAGGLMSALLFKGAKYKVTLSDNREWTIDVPRNAGTTYRLPPIRVVES